MDKINYQGRKIEVEPLSYMERDWETGRYGLDTLLRDDQGIYYLQRETHSQVTGTHWARQHPEETDYRRFVHRVNINAAILWAIHELGNGDTMSLRHDAADILMEGRIYDEPFALNLNNARRKDGERTAASIASLNVAGDYVTVPLTLSVELYRQVLALGAYDGRENFSRAVAIELEVCVEAWLDQEAEESLPFLEKYKAELDAGQHPDVWPPQVSRMIAKRHEFDEEDQGLGAHQNLPVDGKRSFGCSTEAGEQYDLPYQGELVSSTLVHTTGGYYKPGYSMFQAVCRADDGRYFLAREIERDVVAVELWPQRSFTLPEGHWLRVKRLSLRAALRMALMNTDEQMVEDVFAAMQKAEEVQEEETSWEANPVRLLDRHAAGRLTDYLDDRPLDDPRDVVNAAVEFFLNNPEEPNAPDTTGECLKAAMSRRLAKEEQPTQTVRSRGLRTTPVMIDACTLDRLEEFRAVSTCKDLRDIVNGMVDTFFTGDCLGDCIRAATQRRLEAAGTTKALHPVTIHLTDNQLGMLRQSAKYDGRTVEEAIVEEMRKFTHETLYQCYDHQPDRIDHGWNPTGPKPPRQGKEEPAPELIASEQTEEEGLRFVVDYPPGEFYPAKRRTLEVRAEKVAEVRRLAAAFQMEPGTFLGLLAVGKLPGQPTHGIQKVDAMEERLEAGHIAFTCLDDALRQRIERAAQSREQAVDEFVAYCVATDVDLWEENMIVHPESGALLRDDGDDLCTEEEEPIGPPLNPGEAARFEQTHGKEYVRFHTYLRPGVDQVAVEQEEAQSRKMWVRIPLHPAGLPSLEVGGRKIELFPEPFPAMESTEEMVEIPVYTLEQIAKLPGISLEEINRRRAERGEAPLELVDLPPADDQDAPLEIVDLPPATQREDLAVAAAGTVERIADQEVEKNNKELPPEQPQDGKEGK